MSLIKSVNQSSSELFPNKLNSKRSKSTGLPGVSICRACRLFHGKNKCVISYGLEIERQ